MSANTPTRHSGGGVKRQVREEDDDDDARGGQERSRDGLPTDSGHPADSASGSLLGELDTSMNDEGLLQTSSRVGNNNTPAQPDSLINVAEPPALESIVSQPPVTTAGLVNEACTCYLNSLLQLLFHLTYLRSAVYRIPSASKPSVETALQELFFHMQERTTPAHTRKLTGAFGWSDSELFIQHDIQEMATLLRDNLEEGMKGTVAEGAISHLFEGRGEQFVETLDKSYVSRSKDVFYDIHIPLGQHTNLLDGLSSLTARDQLVGDNKYKVEQEGKPAVYMDAEKGYAFKKFPPVTWFHLKRFAMDLTSPTLEMKKVNSRMEFPLELDLTSLEMGISNEEEEEGGAAEGRRGSAVDAFSVNSPAIYDLQGVIVHRGTVRSGHYYCYIREWDPQLEQFTRWVEFEDESTRVVTDYTAVTSNYGGVEWSGYDGGASESPLRNANAYILSYVRRADAPRILAPSPTDIITQRVKDALMKEIIEEEEKRRAEVELKQQLHLSVVTDAGLAAYCTGYQVGLLARDSRTADTYADCVLNIRKDSGIYSVYELLAADPRMAARGVTRSNCRLWRFISNQGTFRPTEPLPTWSKSRRAGKCFSDILSQSEMDRPLAMCVYLQEPMPLLSSPIPSVSAAPPFRTAAEMKNTYSLDLREPTCIDSITVLLDGACKEPYCRVHASVSTASEAVHNVSLKCTMRDNHIIQVPLDPTIQATCVSLQCIPAASRSAVGVRDVHMNIIEPCGDVEPPPAATTRRKKQQRLSAHGPDRVLLFLKFFDHTSCTVRYVGSVVIDKSAFLSQVEALLYELMGGGGGAVVKAGTLRFYEDYKDFISRELSPSLDLFHLRLTHGSVIVAQNADIPLVYQHARVETYYRSLSMSMEVRVLELQQQQPLNAEEAYRKALSDRAKRHQVETILDTGGSAVSLSPANGTNPYDTTLPTLGQTKLCTVSSEVVHMSTHSDYDAMCDCIGRVAGVDPGRIRLYRNVDAQDPRPYDRPLRSDITLEALMYMNSFAVSPVLFFERLNAPRVIADQNQKIVVTLRDAVGRALHRQRYTLVPRETLQGVVRRVRHSLKAWEDEADTWGTLRATLTASHYIMVTFDATKGVIRHIWEVPMGISSSSEVRLGVTVGDLHVYIQPRPRLAPDELRIACCHGHYSNSDSLHTHGHPFVITIDTSVTVEQAVATMLQTVSMSAEALVPHAAGTGPNYQVMMLTEVPLHFTDWSQYLCLYWHHTKNTSGFIPSLMLNHPRPREKPGSRYVAHNNPQLKISGRN